MKQEANEKPSVRLTYKTTDTLKFIEKIFKESTIEGLSGREYAQVINCVKILKDKLLEQPIANLSTHSMVSPLKKNNNNILIKKGEVNGK